MTRPKSTVELTARPISYNFSGMMAGVNQDEPRVTLADEEKLKNVADISKPDVIDEISCMPSCNNEKPSTSNSVLKECDDVVGFEGELTILETVESDDGTEIEIDDGNFKETKEGVEQISSHFVDNGEERQDEKNATSSTNVYDIKNTINEVFWDKINSK